MAEQRFDPSSEGLRPMSVRSLLAAAAPAPAFAGCVTAAAPGEFRRRRSLSPLRRGGHARLACPGHSRAGAAGGARAAGRGGGRPDGGLRAWPRLRARLDHRRRDHGARPGARDLRRAAAHHARAASPSTRQQAICSPPVGSQSAGRVMMVPISQPRLGEAAVTLLRVRSAMGRNRHAAPEPQVARVAPPRLALQ